MENRNSTLALIGYTGHVTDLFADEFYKMGSRLRILASNPDKMSDKYSGSEIVKETMMNPEDVVQVIETADAAFFCTPMGIRNDKTLEVSADKSIVEEGKLTNVKQLIYVLVMGADKPSENSILEAKANVFPAFRMTTLESYLEKLLRKQ